jgi:hypothetical protein
MNKSLASSTTSSSVDCMVRLCRTMDGPKAGIMWAGKGRGADDNTAGPHGWVFASCRGARISLKWLHTKLPVAWNVSAARTSTALCRYHRNEIGRVCFCGTKNRPLRQQNVANQNSTGFAPCIVVLNTGLYWTLIGTFNQIPKQINHCMNGWMKVVARQDIHSSNGTHRHNAEGLPRTPPLAQYMGIPLCVTERYIR